MVLPNLDPRDDGPDRLTLTRPASRIRTASGLSKAVRARVLSTQVERAGRPPIGPTSTIRGGIASVDLHDSNVITITMDDRRGSGDALHDRSGRRGSAGANWSPSGPRHSGSMATYRRSSWNWPPRRMASPPSNPSLGRGRCLAALAGVQRRSTAACSTPCPRRRG
jgi:hypothetical protein